MDDSEILETELSTGQWLSPTVDDIGIPAIVPVPEECYKYIRKCKWDDIQQPAQNQEELKICELEEDGLFMIMIEGPQDIKQQACSHVMSIMRQVKTTRFRMKSLGDDTEPVADTVSDIEQSRQCSIKYSSTNTPTCATGKGKETRVRGLLHKMQDVEADVIVNTTNTSLSLQVGKGVSEAIARAGGSGIGEELKQNYPQGIDYGEVAVSGPGRMTTCKTIYHGALPIYKGQEKEQLDHCYGMLVLFILNCLKKATSSDFKTIAFPALGTGNLQYPLQNVVQLIYQTALRFLDNNPGSSLEDVLFIIYPTTKPLIRQLFVMENLSCHLDTTRGDGLQPLHRELQNATRGCCEARLQVGNTYIQVINSSVQPVCDITKSVLILWFRKDLEGENNPFLACVDPNIEQHVYKECISKLKHNKCVIDKTLMPERTVIHSVYSKDEVKQTITAVCRGIKMAIKEGLTTLTIPIVSDGSPLWRPDSSAQIIMEAIRKVKPVDIIISIAIPNGVTFEPFVAMAMESTDRKLFISPDTTTILNNVWSSFSSRDQSQDQQGDAVLSVTSDSENTNKEAAREFEERLNIRIVYTMTGR